eukprot:m.49694 g.49694  ORF g.49694 m.49694 type:complete len:345 (+) comp12494_c1_seq1:131-1165(+)
MGADGHGATLLPLAALLLLAFSLIAVHLPCCLGSAILMTSKGGDQATMAAAPTSTPPRVQPPHIKFLFGGLAGMGATLVVQPLDLLKNRMQIAGGKTSFITVVRTLLREEGILALYNGLSAGLLRQATYTTTRLGVYNMLLDKFASDGSLSFGAKAAMGLTAGAVGAVVGTPAEVALIRMSSDGSRPAAERRNYTSVANALTRIAREEGVLSLWRGCTPTVLRAMVVNAAQLATYTQAKQFIEEKWNLHGISLHFSASMISGLATTAASMPVDILKTRIQNMRIINGVPEFKGAGEVAVNILRQEGVFAFWKGFLPYYARLGPHTVLTFIILEQLGHFFNVLTA